MAGWRERSRRNVTAFGLLTGLDGALPVRAAAEAELIAMGPGGVDLLLEYLREVPLSRGRTACYLAGAYALMAVGICAGVWAASRLTPAGIPLVLPSLLAPAVIIPVLYYGFWRTLRRQGARALAAHGGVRALGFLAQAAVSTDEETHQPSRLALVELLPGLSPDDASCLELAQRACLWRLLPVAEADLVLAVLAFAERTGDTSALPAVERLAGGAGLRARDPEVHQAAIRCLTALQAAIGREHAARTLLRPTSCDEPATLLRPAAPAEPASEQALLRPREGDDA